MGISKKVRNAIFIGVLCSVSYLAVYFARNILSAVTPQMIEKGVLTTEFGGTLSSMFFTFYAVGQLINGVIGDKIKAKYMICGGLLLSGVANIIFTHCIMERTVATVAYAMVGFFLSMIYGPMTKVVAENTEPVYATRCSLGYTFSSFFGSPLAGVFAAILAWDSVANIGSAALIIMAMVCFGFFLVFEKKGIVKYNQYKAEKSGSKNIKVLIEYKIIKFSLISIITGVVRTAVIFWLPTYISQYLGYSSEKAAAVFTIATFIISFTTFIAVFVYERLKNNMDLTLIIMFSVALVGFALVYFVRMPVMNIIFMVIAVMGSNGAAAMIWSRYCPSLRDTGMVSTATGFLDFLSYMAAAVSSSLFANAVEGIGWKNLILVWLGLMVIGFITVLPHKAILAKLKKENATAA